MNKLGQVIALAATAHQFDTDKGGHAYILHPIRLMMRLRTEDEELMMVAILHDVLEDHPVFAKELNQLELSTRVMAALDCLTHRDVGQTYDEYIAKVATNKDAILVKLEDLRDNSCLTRLKGLRPKDFARNEKYIKAYHFLKEALKNF